METINNSKARVGNITSSEGAVAIMSEGKVKGSFGKPALTYIEECNWERRMGRSIDKEIDTMATNWGNLVEPIVFDLLGLEYQLSSKETIQHPIISYWVGTPDAKKFGDYGTVADIKAPFTVKSFLRLVSPLYNGLSGMEAMNAIRFGYTDKKGTWHDKHQDGEKFYWQLVSGAVLTGSRYAELIPFCPYKSQLEIIRDSIQSLDGETMSKYYRINNAHDDELPWIPDGGYYKNLNVIRFEVPAEDKIALHQRMVEAGKLLINI